jgi:hypothetical protein
MHLYRQPILLFGAVLPVIATAALIGIFSMLKSKMVASSEIKEKSLKASEVGRRAGLTIEAEVGRQRQHLNRWKTQLSAETASAVTTHLREISEHLPTKEIQQTSFERPSGSGGLGAISAQSSSQVRIAFRGTFRTMQRAFLELETRMPQLQLQDLKIDPSNTQSSLLNFQVTYTAWEN